jgi:hypothetical protein
MFGVVLLNGVDGLNRLNGVDGAFFILALPLFHKGNRCRGISVHVALLPFCTDGRAVPRYSSSP